MRVIISPAKKMRERDELGYRSLPVFLEQARALLEYMRGQEYEQLKALWKCNEQIATQNWERLLHMDLTGNLTPAILAYDGIQYQYMAPAVFEEKSYAYLEEHLRILSGFYGMLRPFDGVTPYRLEMQANIDLGGCKSLYAFWGSRIARQLTEESSIILNLASREYSKVVEPYLEPGVRLVRCVFGERINGKTVEKGVYVKMARGEMVRFMAERQIGRVEELKSFCRLDYCYAEEFSTENELVFIQARKGA